MQVHKLLWVVLQTHPMFVILTRYVKLYASPAPRGTFCSINDVKRLQSKPGRLMLVMALHAHMIANNDLDFGALPNLQQCTKPTVYFDHLSGTCILWAKVSQDSKTPSKTQKRLESRRIACEWPSHKCIL